MNTTLHSEGPIWAALRKVFSIRNPRTVVRSMAHDLYRSVQPPGPPFSPFLYAASLGLNIDYQEIEAEAVFVSAGGNTPNPRIILRKPSDPLERVYRRRLNFTLAHEIGHFVIRRELSGHLPDSVLAKETAREEILCNLFAEELLMPGRLVRRDFERAGLRPNQIIPLIDRYDVSLQCLLCRATNLYRQALATVLWANREGRWSVEWASPFSYRNVILCDTKATTVERAFGSSEPQFGLDSVLLHGQRMRWYSASQRLVGTSKILTLMARLNSDVPHLRPRPERRFQDSSPPTLHIPIQQWLPFSV
jgi:IrrE N-terminal-like domain